MSRKIASFFLMAAASFGLGWTCYYLGTLAPRDPVIVEPPTGEIVEPKPEPKVEEPKKEEPKAEKPPEKAEPKPADPVIEEPDQNKEGKEDASKPPQD